MDNSRVKIKYFFTKKRLIIILIILLLLCALLALQAVSLFRTEPSGRPRFLFSIKGQAGEPFIAPLAVAVSGNRVYVVDSGRGRVEVFSTEGRFQFDFQVRAAPSEGEVSPSQTSYPVGITIGKISKEERVFVSDLRSRKVMVFNADGDLLGFVENGSLKKPLALAFFEEKLFVTDIGDQTVKILTPAGKLLKKIGRGGSKPGQLSFPNGIAIYKLGIIYVADSNNGRIQTFSPDGGYRSHFSGSSGERLSLPRGIAFDKKNRLHVVDALGRKVFVFSKTEKLLFTYGKENGPAGERLFSPNGIAVDNLNKRIFITDRGNNSVSVWKY